MNLGAFAVVMVAGRTLQDSRDSVDRDQLPARRW